MDEVADDRPIDQRHLQLGRPVQEDVAQTWGFLHRSILNPPIPGSSGKNTKIIRFNQTTNKVGEEIQLRNKTNAQLQWEKPPKSWI